MRIRFWGCRGSIPVPDSRMMKYGGNTPCLEVSLGDRTLVIDAGTGIRKLGEDLQRRGVSSFDLFITHSHWDHIQGFPFFLPAYRSGTAIRIFGRSGSYGHLQDILARQMSSEFFPITFPELASRITFAETWDLAGDGDDAHAEFLRLNHPIYTLGIKVRHGDATFVFMTDNELRAADPGTYAATVAFCAGADWLVHDAQFTDAEYPQRTGWGHSTFEQATALAEEAGVKNLIYYHHDPNRRDDELDLLETRFAEYCARRNRGVQARCAHEGMEIEG